MSKRQELREKRRQQARMQQIGVIAVIALIAAIVVGGVIWSQKPVEGIVQATPIARPQVKFNATGDPNAPVKIIEYADFQCPFCRNFWRDTEAQIVDAYVKTGKVYLEYHSFGTFIGDESGRAAEAAYCAGDQEKFWEMHDAIFANQGVENSGALDDTHLIAIAKVVPGLDIAAFTDCFTGGKYKGKVSQDGLEAKQAGVQSTPSFMINGKLVEGAQPFATFQQEIDAALTAASAK